MLSESQIDQYHQDGFVIPDYRVPNDTLEAIKEDHDRFLRRFPEFRDYCPSSLIYDTAFLNYARNPDIVGMVAQLIGENVVLWNSSFFAKPALNGTKTPWHQDGEFWPIRPLASRVFVPLVEGLKTGPSIRPPPRKTAAAGTRGHGDVSWTYVGNS